MKVFIVLPTQSRGIKRVHDALIRYMPDNIELVTNYKKADLVILHVIGRHKHTQRKINELKRLKIPYAMIQYCIRSTMNPNTEDWMTMWRDARLVWSYYDLYRLCEEDAIKVTFPFYYAPLGVDPIIFSESKRSRQYKILASGKHALSESVRECAFAVKRVKGKMLHLGHDLRRGEDIVAITDIPDRQLAWFYSSCEFVSGLRRIEGFEFPIIEGALCGARPIVFDKPHYRKWFSEFAIFIPERSRDQVINDLELIFKIGTVPISDEEKQLIKERFNWETIITNFWNKII